MKPKFIMVTMLMGTAIGAVGIYIKNKISKDKHTQNGNSIMIDSTLYDKEIKTQQDIQTLLHVTIDELEARSQYAQEQLKNSVKNVLALSPEDRNAHSFIKALDDLIIHYGRVLVICNIMTMVHPNKDIREKAATLQQLLQELFVDQVEMNKSLYEAMVQYAASVQCAEETNYEIKHFVKEWLLQGKRSGLLLSQEERQSVGLLKKELSQMETTFEIDLAKDIKKVTLTDSQLQGLPTDTKQSFKKNDDGSYTITLNSSIYITLMENCSLEATRKMLFEAYGTRGYPENKNTLEAIAKKRHELASLLGYESYARYDLENQMIKTPERAQLFLNDLLKKVVKKADVEVALFKRNLPEGVTLSKNGVFKPWDLIYVESCYKKQNYNVDELKIAEYFPLESTIQGLFLIYETFFGLSMQEVKVPTLWHEDIRLLKISKNDGAFIGHVILDLHPRDNKYGHACQCGIVSGHKDEIGTIIPGLGLVIANFTKPTKEKPALLKYDEVVTFFHEFGHALHSLLGATYLQTLAGTNVKTDFVELPSQLLELWMEEKIILKNISKHYKTQEPIPGVLVDNKLESDRLSYGIYLSRQIMLGMISLSLFDKHEGLVDTDVLWKEIHAKTASGITEYCPDVHPQSSFGHLASSGYAAKYYGYLWACVMSNDIFEKIKRDGLLNPAVGRAYTAALLAPGGSKDPNDMVYEFLEREPRQDAFLNRYGLQ